MNEAKQTPGPYEAWPVQDDRLKRWVVVCVNEQRCPGTGKEVLAEKIRTEANARLFAAAPELLEALEAARIEHLTCADSYYSCPKSGDHPRYSEVEFASCDCGADQHNDRIARALAKARGEAA